MRWFAQALAYALFAGLLAALSVSPAWQHHDPALAQIKLSFSHGGARKGGCRTLSAEELSKLAPNMRQPTVCPRERVPLLLDLELDGETLYHAELPPSGLAGDGPSRVYRRFAVAPGPHRLRARLRDSERETGYDYEAEREMTLAPRENYVIDFKAPLGGFQLR